MDQQNSSNKNPDSRTMHDIPEDMRPREAFKKLGVAKLSNEQLLAIILRSGKPGMNVMDLAHKLLETFGGLRGLSTKEYGDLMAATHPTKIDKNGKVIHLPSLLPGLGEVKAMELACSLELGRRLTKILKEEKQTAQICNPSDIYDLLESDAYGLPQEHFWVVMLDVKNHVIEQPVEVSLGTIDTALVHPRDVFSRPIRFAAAGIIIAHNHPSGDPTPSAQDIGLTKRIIACGEMLGIRVLDHIVIGKQSPNHPEFISLRQQKLVSFT